MTRILILFILLLSTTASAAPRTLAVDILKSSDHTLTWPLPSTSGTLYILPSLTAGSVLFSNGTTIVQDNSKFFWDDTNFQLSLGGHLHTAALGISQTGGSSVGFDLTNTSTNTAFQVENQGAQYLMQITNATNSATQGAAIGGAFSRGTTASRSAVQAGDQVATWSGQSYNGSAFGPGYNAAMAIIATENQTSTHNGGEFVIATTPNAALAPVAGFILNQDQSIQIPHYTSNGFVKTGSSNGTISIDTTPYVSSVSGTSPIVSSGGATPAISCSVASGSQAGCLSSSDWNTFNGKFTLPSLTAGSVIFSNGSTLSQDNANFFWDNTTKRLKLNGPTSHVGNLIGLDSALNITDPATDFNADHDSDVSLHMTSAITSALYNDYSSNKVLIDIGVTVGGGNINYGGFIDRQDPADLGTSGTLAGSYNYISQANGAKTTPLYAAYLTGGNSVNDGTITDMYDLYAQPSSLTAGTVTNRYGIYLDADSGYTKHNWISGDIVLGGATYSAPSTTLSVQGDMIAQKTVTDAGVAAGIFSATSDTTVNGSNATIGINGAAVGTVEAGAENDKSVGGMNFAVTRGNGTDQGILDAMTGANVLLFHNSDPTGVTQKVFGLSTLFFSQQGTVTDLYDFYSERIPAGTGVVTNHYGVYVKDDSSNLVKNWLGGHTQIGGSSFSLVADAALDIEGTNGAMLFPRLTTAQKTALTPTAGMEVYDTDLAEYDCYTAGSWGNCGVAGGGGMNTSMSNMNSPVQMSQDLTWASNNGQHQLLTNNETTMSQTSDAMIVKTGDSNQGLTGTLQLFTGNVADPNALSSGAILLESGQYSGTPVQFSSGAIQLFSGASYGGVSGEVDLDTGVDNNGGNSGNVELQTGSATGSGISGEVGILTGLTSAGTSGRINISTGVTSGGGTSGDAIIHTGDTETSASGSIGLSVGTVQDPNSNSGGNITILAGGFGGTPTGPFNGGNIILQAALGTMGGTNGIVQIGGDEILFVNTHLVIQSNPGVVATTASPTGNAGTGATCTLTSSTDTSGQVTLVTTGVSPSAGDQCDLTFGGAFVSTAPVCVFSPGNDSATIDSVIQGVYTTATTTQLSFNFANSDVVGRTYVWNYHCFGNQ